MLEQSELNILKKNLTIENALDSIKQLENSIGEKGSALVKWKNYNNQVVVEAKNYYYKIYEESKDSVGPFNSIIRSKLAEIYQELGIDWKILIFERDGHIFNFEQRQKLSVIGAHDIPFTEILLSFSQLLDELEEMLEFDVILSQLKKNECFDVVKKLKLLRFCVNKQEDYAIFDEQVVLLDDADWVVLPVDNQGEVVLLDPNVSVPVETSYGKFLFTSALYLKFEGGKINPCVPKFNESTHGWYLLPSSDVNESTTSIVLVHKKQKEFVNSSNSFVKDAIDIRLKNVSKVETDVPQSEDCVEIECKLDNEQELDLYFQLQELTNSQKAIKLIINYDFGQCDAEVWGFHMNNIYVCYPNVERVTRISLSQENCERYVEGGMKFNEFQNRNHTSIEFLKSRDREPSKSTLSKFLRELQKRDPQEYENLLNSKLNVFKNTSV